MHMFTWGVSADDRRPVDDIPLHPPTGYPVNTLAADHHSKGKPTALAARSSLLLRRPAIAAMDMPSWTSDVLELVPRQP
ncbi:hypothetical protein BD309DRAFT_834586, partial [Dichomitus squalens]